MEKKEGEGGSLNLFFFNARMIAKKKRKGEAGRERKKGGRRGD